MYEDHKEEGVSDSEQAGWYNYNTDYGFLIVDSDRRFHKKHLDSKL